MNIHERFGRVCEELEKAREAHQHEHAEHLRTIEVLRLVVAGELERSRVMVSGASWTVRPEADPPTTGTDQIVPDTEPTTNT